MRILTNEFWYNEDFEDVLNQHKLLDFKRFINFSQGNVIRTEPEKTVQFIELDSEAASLRLFIKNERPHLLSHLKHLVRSKNFMRLSTRHELDLIRIYQSKNFPVVEPVAWGEQRIFGIPLFGFLVQKEVPGLEFVDLMKILPTEERSKMVKAYGKLVASLHSAGLISSVVRVTDLIVSSPVEGEAWDEISLVIIDREKGPLASEKYCLENASDALSSIVVRFVLYIGFFSKDEISYFFDIYFSLLNINNYHDISSIMNITQKKINSLCVKYSNLLNSNTINII